MTDFKLNSLNDLDIVNGDVVIIDTLGELTRQRLVMKLRSFTGTLFTDINYGINVDLVFAKGTKELLDQHLKELIQAEQGIIELVRFESFVDRGRNYHCDFEYKVVDGEIVGIRGLRVGGSTSTTTAPVGIWRNGYWDYSGSWSNEEIWGDN